MIVELSGLPVYFDHDVLGMVELTHRRLRFLLDDNGPHPATVQSVLGTYFRDRFVEIHDTRDAVRFTREELDRILEAHGERSNAGDVSMVELAELAEPIFVRQWAERMESEAHAEERKRTRDARKEA